MSERRASNSLPPAWQAGALPIELLSRYEQGKGLEPSTTDLEGRHSTN